MLVYTISSTVCAIFAATIVVRRFALALNSALMMGLNSSDAVGSVEGAVPHNVANESVSGRSTFATSASEARRPRDAVNHGAKLGDMPGGRAMGSSRQRVYGARLVKAFPFYGYHPDEKLWIKIFLYDPKDVPRAAALLQAGAVLGRQWQPHESHVPYLLQVKADFNLHGMGWINVGKVRFRKPLPKSMDPGQRRVGWALRNVIEETEPRLARDTTTRQRSNSEMRHDESPSRSLPTSTTMSGALAKQRFWLESNTPENMLWDACSPSTPARRTSCELELDVNVMDVFNRTELRHIYLKEAGENVKMIESLVPMWREEQERCPTTDLVPQECFDRHPVPIGPMADQLLRRFINLSEEIKRKTDLTNVFVDNRMSRSIAETPQLTQSYEADASGKEDSSGAGAIDDDVENTPMVSGDGDALRWATTPSITNSNLLNATQAANETPGGAAGSLVLTEGPRSSHGRRDDHVPSFNKDRSRQDSPRIDECIEEFVDKEVVAATQKAWSSEQDGGRYSSQEILFHGDEDEAAHALRGTLYEEDKRAGQEEHDLLMNLAMNISSYMEGGRTPREIHLTADDNETVVWRERWNEPSKELHTQQQTISQSEAEQLQVDTLSDRLAQETQRECNDILEASMDVNLTPGHDLEEPKSEEQHACHHRRCGEDLIEKGEISGPQCEINIVKNKEEEDRKPKDSENRNHTVLTSNVERVPQQDGAFDDFDDDNAEIRVSEMQENSLEPSNVLHEPQKGDHTCLDGGKSPDVTAAETTDSAGGNDYGDRQQTNETKLGESVRYASKEKVKSAMKFLATSHGLFVHRSKRRKESSRSFSCKEHTPLTNAFGTANTCHRSVDEAPQTQLIALSSQEGEYHEQGATGMACYPLNASGAADEDRRSNSNPQLNALFSAYSSSWWREEASQIPFDEDAYNWDLIDMEENHVKPSEEDKQDTDVSGQSHRGRDMEAKGTTIESRLPCDTRIQNDLVLFHFHRAPPSNAELISSCWQHGIQPIVHLAPHYSDPSHVPDQPIVFAGKEFRIRSSAVVDLDPFLEHSAFDFSLNARQPSDRLSELQRHRSRDRSRLADVAGRARGISHKYMAKKHATTYSDAVLTLTFARQPPSRRETEQWLSKEHAYRSSPSSMQNGSPDHEENSRHFTMDANTGRAVPAKNSRRNECVAEPATNNYNNGNQRLIHRRNYVEEIVDDDDLLGTPEMRLSMSLSGPGSNKTCVTPAAGICTKPDTSCDVKGKRTIPEPASPKYDERVFFYSNPYGEDDLISPRGTSNRSNLHNCPKGRPKSTLRAIARDDGPGMTEKASAVKQEAPEEACIKGYASAAKAVDHCSGPTRCRASISLITPPYGSKCETPFSQIGMKRTIVGKGQGLTLLSVEIHADCRGHLLPDPRYDAVRVVVLAIMDDDEEVSDGQYFVRMFVCDENRPLKRRMEKEACLEADREVEPSILRTETPRGSASLHNGLQGQYQIEYCSSEKEILDMTVVAIRSLDPDIVMGFEVQQWSLGYLAERAAVAYDRPNFLQEISRDHVDRASNSSHAQKGRDASEADRYGWQHATGFHIPGRITLNIWRIMRDEVKINSYSLENCVASVLRLRIPHFPHHQLSTWFSAAAAAGRWRTMSHVALRARMSLLLLERLDVVGRTAEMARCFGIDFFSVISRGSQYRVESMVLRLAHSQNYVAVAPSAEQVARQAAMEALPLILEPQSQMYVDPVCVLDFQSLYPSMIIAYNLCYSTCLGRPEHAASEPPMKLGCCEYRPPASALVGDAPGASGLIVAPNGVGFVPPTVRPGILPRLLREILDTRVMVKAAMKRLPPEARVLLRCLNARQFSLKLIANVTYGYTAAGFSGRMPMAELADAIVQSGRETLESAIRMVEEHPTWRAKVVYGDTDSLFVQLPGRSMEEAFDIGAEIAAAVTASNPDPVTLKLDKIYRPCVLLSKKRYAGAMYESPTQVKSTFDAKGIETVRRDTCPAVAKIMEKTLRLLFASADLSVVRGYLEHQWKRILAERVSVADFVFAKEVRLGSYSTRTSVIPPAALVATRAMTSDPRAEPRYGERVPYVVVYGEPGARLIDMVVSPRALIESKGRLRLHSLYYITKQIIPAVERVLSIVGADVRQWFSVMPRPGRTLPQKRPMDALPLERRNNEDRFSLLGSYDIGDAEPNRNAGTIDLFYLSKHCAVCDELTHASEPLCGQCGREPQLTTAVLSARCRSLQKRYVNLVRICLSCGGGSMGNARGPREDGGVACDSIDCGLFFERKKVSRELRSAEVLVDIVLERDQ